MAKETFSVIALEETHHWAEGLLEENGIEAAFGIYLIRHGERTHICSFTPNSWCEWLQNEFAYDADNEDAHEWAGENDRENGGEYGGYFELMDPETMDPRFVALTFTVEVEDDLTPEGRETEAYHDAIWEAARELAHEADCNGNLFPDIANLPTYLKYQAELAAKRRAENRKPLASPILDLFWVAAQRTGITTYEDAIAIGWL